MNTKWNRLLSLLLSIMLLACVTPSLSMAETSNDDELSQAFASALAPDFWGDQLDTPMAINDFCALMMRIIEPFDASLLPEWESLAGTALGSTCEMKREDAMIAVYQAACLMGQGRDTTGDWLAVDALLSQGEHFWELSNEYPEWNNLDNDAPFCTDCDKIIGGAYHFAQGQVSLISGKRVFDLDEENKDLHMLDPLTKGEALLILQRFGESLHVKADDYSGGYAENQKPNDPAPKFIPLSDAAVCILSDEMLAVASEMPALSAQQDGWRGTSLALDTVPLRTDHRLYRQEDCQAIADMGFNYVRLQIDCAQLLNEEGLIDQTILENIDNVIYWCAQAGVHVNLDLHSVPGYGTGLPQDQKDILTNPAHAALAEELWRTLAKRYQNVSPGALSYNLVNEPTAFDFTQEEYAALAQAWIAAIRESGADKMILSDGMLSDSYHGLDCGWDGACPSMPVKLLDASVGQTIHLYPCFSYLESNYIALENWPYEHMPVVAGMIHDDYALDVTGNFKAGTIVEYNFANINGVNAGNTLEFRYNKHKESIPLDGFAIGENHCQALTTDDYGTLTAEFDASNANGYTLRFELEEDTKSFSLKPGKGSNIYAYVYSLFIRIPTETEATYMIPDNGNRAGFSYETGCYETRYFAYRESTADKKNVLHLEEKLPTADHDAEGDSFDMETLRRYLQYWRDWADETGAFIMCNEFGIPIGFPQALRESYYRTLFTLFEEYRIPWALYTNQYENWGPVVSVGIEEWNTLPADGSLVRKGDTYVDETLLSIIKEYRLAAAS